MANLLEKQDALQSVVEKLTAALDGIEQRFDTHLDEFAKHSESSDNLIDVQREREALKMELDEAREQAGKLASANQDVANRLDTVISSIKTVLGNG
ncbi:MAG: DUF4164 family protein [Methyloligellaceae bacterium]